MTIPASPGKKSTIVRSLRRTASGAALQAGFRTLEHLAPDLGARLALRLWCTPGRRPARVAPSAPGPTRAGVGTFTGPYDGAAFTVAVDGGTVVGRAWGSGPVVYLAHGWGGSAAQLTGFVAPLVAAGYRVVSWDALSHGRSGPGASGRHRATLIEFADALRAVVGVNGRAHAVIAHSLGGAATALAVLDGLAVDGLVLIAPMADPSPYLREFRRVLGIGTSTGARFLDRLETLAGRALADLDIAARAARSTDLPPLLVLRDERDREVLPSDGTALAAAWPGRLHRTTGLGHLRILADHEVIERAVEFVSRLTPIRTTESVTAGTASD